MGEVFGFSEPSGKALLKTIGAGAVPGATMKVSILKRPTKRPYPTPRRLVSISPWYQDSPKGPFGTWITKKSKSVFGGKPHTVTSIISTGPTDSTVTLPWAFGTNLGTLLRAGERTRSNLRSSLSEAMAGVEAKVAKAKAVRASLFGANSFFEITD